MAIDAPEEFNPSMKPIAMNKITHILIALLAGNWLAWAEPAGAQEPIEVTLEPVDDSYVVDENPDTCCGDEELLFTHSGSNIKRTYLKFDLGGIPSSAITGASLRLCYGQNANDGTVIDLHHVADDAWSESNLTWNCMPTYDEPALCAGTTEFGEKDLAWALPATALHSDINGQLSLMLKIQDESHHSGTARFYSTEAAVTLAVPPRLQLTLLDTTPPEISCPSDFVVNIAATQTETVVDYTLPVASDEFPGVTLVCTPASGTIFPVGTNTVVCVATDASGNTNSCTFIIVVNREPLPENDSMIAIENNAATVPWTAFTANDEDPDGQPLSLVAVSLTSTNGGTAVLADSNIIYTPLPGFTGSDLFTYTVSDSLGGTAEASVAVNVLPETDPSYKTLVLLSVPPAPASFSMLGIPGTSYKLERSGNLMDWIAVDSGQAPADGVVVLTDPNPPASRAFYRMVSL